MPIACTNCLRYHFGHCREAPKQCFRCGNLNHIERYCPNKRGVRVTSGEPLPGTRAWCDMYGLQRDPVLKDRVLNALKVAPGSAIYVSGVCIYRGYEQHFARDDDLRARQRPFEEPVARRRSRSPIRERGRMRSRSPLPRRDDYNVRRYRTPSLNRYRIRSPSPYRYREPRSRSPRAVQRSSAVAFEARDRYRDNRPIQRSPSPPLPRVRFDLPPKLPAIFQTPSQPFQIKGIADASRAPLQSILANVPKKDADFSSVLTSTPKLATNVNIATANGWTPTLTWTEALTSMGIELRVDDPWFVLGINQGALETEIVDAYQQRIFEVELDRMSQGVFDDVGVGAENV